MIINKRNIISRPFFYGNKIKSNEEEETKIL
jgi:hypothetical protein